MNIYNSKEYQECLIHRQKYFNKENLINRKELTDISYFGDFPKGIRLYEEKYFTGEGCSNYTRLVIEFEDGSIFNIDRNYSSINYFGFINNGIYYLAAGIDYQGLTIVNLNNKTQSTYIPKGWLRGFGWCITDFLYWDEHKKILECEGCYWGGDINEAKFTIRDLENLDDIDFEIIYNCENSD